MRRSPPYIAVRRPKADEPLLDSIGMARRRTPGANVSEDGKPPPASVLARRVYGRTTAVRIHVRIANESDAPAVRQILTASYPALMACAYDAALLERALPVIMQPNLRLLSSGTYYLAEADDLPIGCGGWSHRMPGSDTVTVGLAHIRHFATDAKWIGRGVGRSIFRACEESAKAQNVEKFEVLSSLNAEPFYQSLGFRRIEVVQVPMPQGILFPSVRMER